jgi:uncharacterized Ntn-hydrolase superfamily protein
MGDQPAIRGAEAEKSTWAGGSNGRVTASKGTGWCGLGVVEAREQAFHETTGSLADRLMAALIDPTS